MAVDMGQARGSLNLDASGFFSSIQSAITELHKLNSATSDASGNVQNLENSLSGVGGGLSGALSNVSGAASGAASGVEDVGDASENASTHTGTFGEKLKSAWEHMKNAIPDTKTLADRLEKFGNKAKDAGTKLTKYITAPLTGIGIYSINTSMNFEKAMSQVQATMGATKEDMVDLEAAAKKMGETTQFTNTEAAQALNYLALAGYNSEQMIAALPNVLNLAAAGGMDLASASDMLTDGLSALNLASEDSDELMSNMEVMVDQMAKTASRSNTSVSQLGDAILTAGGTATYLSGGLTEINQVIGLLADRGIKASEAGTHLRNIILAMQPATDAAEAAFIKVGLGIRDADGQFQNLAYNADGTLKPLSEVFQMLQEGMADMSDQEKQGVLADMFHRTDLAAANALIGTSIERWDELGQEIENSAGAGSQMAATQLDNAAGKLTLLKSQIEALATSIGDILIPKLQPLLDKISDLVTKFSQLDDSTQNTVINLGLFAAAVGPATATLGNIATGFSRILKVGQKIAPIFSALGSSVVSGIAKLAPAVQSGVAALAAPATLGLSTVLIGLAAFIAGYGIGTLIYEALQPQIDEVLWPIFDAIVDAWDTVVSFFTESIPQAFSTFAGYFSTGIDEITEFFGGIVTSIGEFFTGIWDTISNTFSGIATWVDENIIQPIMSIVEPIVTKIAEIVAKIWEIITTLFSVAASWVNDNVIKPIYNFVSGLANSVIAFFQNIWNGIVTIFTSAASWWSTNVIQPIYDGVNGLVNGIVDFFTWAWDGITTVFSSIGEWFSDRWQDIKDVFSGISEWFADIFDAAVEAIKGVFGSIYDWFSDIWEDIKGIFSGAAEAISEGFEGAFKAVFNGVMTTVEGIVNFFVDAVNGVIDIINDIPGVDISKLDRLSLPRLSVGLDYVPYDDYQALLHKGERVLTKEENEAYTANQTQGGNTFNFYSPEPIDEVTAAQEFKRVQQELVEGF